MKKTMDLKSLWDRASKKQKMASGSTPKPLPVEAGSRPQNQTNPSPSSRLQVVPVQAQRRCPTPVAGDDRSGDKDDESIASNSKQLQAEALLDMSRLTRSLQCLRFILQQGLPVHGHDESEGSHNAGNFLELLNWLAEGVEEVKRLDLKDAPIRREMIDRKTQDQLINSCAKETTRLIMEDLGDDYFAVLVYESRDMEQQEQLAICLRFVGKKGTVVERFLGIVGVEDTTDLTVKTTIENLLLAHSLKFSMVRGLGYDGANCIKSYANGLKKLIMDESPSVYYVHCFGHQLELNIVALARQNVHCGLQKREQNIVNAIDLVCVTKKRLQSLREDVGWESFLQKVTSFCVEHDVEVVDMDGLYEPVGRCPRFYEEATNLHYYHVDMFLDVIDSQLRELNDMFDEVNTELLISMASFNPADSYAARDVDKLVKLAHLYPEDFSTFELLHLPFQLDTFFDLMRQDERFREVKTLAELTVKLVETRLDSIFHIVYRLLKLVLILPVATASVERNLSSVNYVNNKATNKLSDQCASDCMVTCLEREIFAQVKDEAIISRFQAMDNCKVVL